MPFKIKDLQREYQRIWMAKRRAAWIESQGSKCCLCESTERLEVDHIDRSKKTMNPAAIWSRKQSVQEIELANCQVLCHSCHKEKTRAERTILPATCGTYRSYKRGCRCQDCKDAYALYRRGLRLKKKIKNPGPQ
jgi:hypothetical protein